MNAARARWREQQRVREWVMACEQLAPPAELFAKIEPYDAAKLANLDHAIAWLTELRSHVKKSNLAPGAVR